MYKMENVKRATAAALALALLSACGGQVAGGYEQPASSTSASASADAKAGAGQKPATKADYTSVELGAEAFELEAGAAYYLPLGEGRYVPADDEVWREYLNGMELSPLESLSMPFVAVDCGDKALVYVIENPYRTLVRFTAAPDVRVAFIREESSLDPAAQTTIRVYTTGNSAAEVADAYKSYIEETREVMTLADKAKINPNVAKLYGAPHIYLWGDFMLAEKDVNWQAFIKAAGSPALARVGSVLSGTEEGTAFADVLKKVAGQDYVDGYQRGVLLRSISIALDSEGFYDGTVFTKSSSAMKPLLAKDKAALNDAERVKLNKLALYENLPGVFKPVDGWYDDATVDILNEMKAAGIDTAWIGLNSYEQTYAKPEIAQAAVKNGYLAGPYDSYHSIHEPGREQWITAAFPDTTLYENATVADKNGNKIGGFQNVGRKLNPTLALPSVKQRVQGVLDTGVEFNSWFVDCDATGEVYDDYSPAHPTTKQQDVAARLERMDYIAQQHGMVVGSEGGNDFAANSIAFAHGIELQSFSWMDDDMKSNRDSEYYLGRYYSAKGGVPEKFAKPVPVKERYRKLFLDMAYQLPLYKLVYNDSVITSYHWDWSTFKISGEVENRMLREVLYNVPPMYHLDRTEWDSYKDSIVAHNAVWSPFSQKAIMQPMTDFRHLSPDRLVQLTSYGDGLTAVANFSGAAYEHNSTAIPPRSVLIIDEGSKSIYTP